MNPIERFPGTATRLVAPGTLAVLAAFAAVLIAAAPVGAMSADSSGYSIVLPSLVSTSSANATVNSIVSVENHSASTVGLTLYYVGARTSANPGLLVCSEQRLTAAPQSFRLEVPPDDVLQFDLRALLEQKCLGSSPPGAKGDRGTLTLFIKGKDLSRISAVARVDAVGPNGETFGFSENGLPLGALEGNTQVIAGLRNGPNLRVDCLVSSFYDASGSGDVYDVTVMDVGRAQIGSTQIALKPWSSERLVDVFALVGARGAVVDGVHVEVTPAANKSRPSMVSSCQVVNLASPASLDTTLHVGKVYEPLDLLRQRRVDTDSTPGWGGFVFVPGSKGRTLHAAFLQAPDLVECGLGDDHLQLIITAPDGHFVAGGCGSTGEFFTGHRGEVNGGDGGAWGVEVDACPSNPPSSATPYRLSCVSGNGMSQMDRLLP